MSKAEKITLTERIVNICQSVSEKFKMVGTIPGVPALAMPTLPVMSVNHAFSNANAAKFSTEKPITERNTLIEKKDLTQPQPVKPEVRIDLAEYLRNTGFCVDETVKLPSGEERITVKDFLQGMNTTEFEYVLRR